MRTVCQVGQILCAIQTVFSAGGMKGHKSKSMLPILLSSYGPHGGINDLSPGHTLEKPEGFHKLYLPAYNHKDVSWTCTLWAHPDAQAHAICGAANLCNTTNHILKTLKCVLPCKFVVWGAEFATRLSW